MSLVDVLVVDVAVVWLVRTAPSFPSGDRDCLPFSLLLPTPSSHSTFVTFCFLFHSRRQHSVSGYAATCVLV